MHRAREIAVAAGVPIVPGTQGLLVTEDDAVGAANTLGYKPFRHWRQLGQIPHFLTRIHSPE
jgi:hypothetical protein